MQRINFIVPIGSGHGWGVCGKNLGRELNRFVEVAYLFPEQQADLFAYRKGILDTQAPILQAAQQDLTAWEGPFASSFRAGLIFADRVIPQAKKDEWHNYWHLLITGCKWSQELLAEEGIASEVVHQGIDPLLFHEGYREKELLKDKFVIFSGGKFEFRKGQDIVIKAFKIFHERYKDSLLVTAWHNSWQESMRSMKDSTHIKFTSNSNDYFSLIQHTLLENDVPLPSVVNLPPLHNSLMPRIYQESDIGLFTSRAEAGTNLVLMEYMACGKPAVLTYTAGHKDLTNTKNAILLKDIKRCELYLAGRPNGVWGEPSVEEVVDRLEWCYHNRTKTALIGRRAAKSMKAVTWQTMAEKIIYLMKGKT